MRVYAGVSKLFVYIADKGLFIWRKIQKNKALISLKEGVVFRNVTPSFEKSYALFRVKQRLEFPARLAAIDRALNFFICPANYFLSTVNYRHNNSSKFWLCGSVGKKYSVLKREVRSFAKRSTVFHKKKYAALSSRFNVLIISGLCVLSQGVYK